MLKLNLKIEDMFIKIQNDMWKDKNLSDIDLIVYCMIKRRISVRDYSVISINDIYNMLQLNNRSYFAEIKNSLIALSELDYIGCYDINLEELDLNKVKPSDNIYIVTEDFCEKYFHIFDKDFNTAIELSKTVKSRFSFLRYFVSLYRVTNDQNYDAMKIGYLTQRTIGFVVKNSATIKTYNELLQKAELFYYNTMFVNIPECKNAPTYFGRCSDVTRYEFDEYVKDRLIAEGYTYISNEVQSYKRKQK